MKESQKKYNAIDFARYHSGTMLPGEMHALEKAALEDPLLADALDGYRHSKDYKKELDEIKMRLDEKRKQNKVFTISFLSSGAWWKIAAMFILFAGIGYFFYATNSKKESSLAIKENVDKKESPVTASPIISDSSASEKNIAFEKPSTEKDKNHQAKLLAPVLKSVQPKPKSREQEKEVVIRKEKNLSDEQQAGKKQGSVAMSSDKISSPDTTLSDPGQKSFLRSSDTTALVAVSPNLSPGESDNIVAMNKTEQLQKKIIIRGAGPETKEDKSLNDVVIVGYGTQKKKSITEAVPNRLEGKVSGVAIGAASPYPKEGKEKFEQFIKNNAVPILDSNGKRIPVNILLSFTLNKRGKPTHIKVLESSCKVCESEAIRLLKEGPDWVGKKATKGTVRIQF